MLGGRLRLVTLGLLAGVLAGGCYRSFEGPDAGPPPDEGPACARFVCPPNAVCIAPGGAPTCRCLDGYRDEGSGACIDIDECAEGACDPVAACTNLAGGFRCACPPGFRGDGRVACIDIDECLDGDRPCSRFATCTNFPGTFFCVCRDGFTGDGRTCDDVDECASGAAGCAPVASCTNLTGAFRCACPPGFVGDGFVCEDVDECADEESPCHPDATCENFDGRFLCACNDGFVGDGLDCADIDECAAELDDCAEVGGECTNEPGSFACACLEGFLGDGVECEDVDECAEGLDDCGPLADCVNSVGGFTCGCPGGTTGPDCDPVFDIQLDFETTVTAAARQAFEAAEERWESLIWADVPAATGFSSLCGAPAGVTTIDDLRIAVRVERIDGPGRILGEASPVCVRDTMGGTRFLPFTGEMRIDSTDIPILTAAELEELILHEMAHVLGVGTGWAALDLVDDPSCPGGICTSGRDSRYNGAEAVDAWQDLGGVGDVPVENRFGLGSADRHWREATGLSDELMSSTFSSGSVLSVVTLRSLDDLGYTPGPDSLADAFTLPIIAGPPPAQHFLGGDVPDRVVWELVGGVLRPL